ncbi:MAG TPA: site-specific integrase [Rhizomicrobium sp.]|nr:site-specific integrase [Rhizomicrobium sp.]
MVMVQLKGIHSVKAKGRTYHYAWRGGPRLQGEPGSAEFLHSLQRAKEPSERSDSTKFASWITRYKSSPEFQELAESTKKQWHPWLDRIKERFVRLSTRQFDRPQLRSDIRRWRDQWRSTPRTADFGKQVLSRVLSFGVAEGALAQNLCKGIPNLYDGDRSEIVWEEADLAALCRSASPEVGYAARLAGLTGLRTSDLFRLCWSHVGEHAIEIKTAKGRGKRTALVPLTSECKSLLADIPRRSTTVLTNSKGRPWRGFSSSWQKAVKDAGLADRDLHFHDLRGTAATNFFRANFTTREIAETLGWSEVRVERLIDCYVRRDDILRDRIRRIEEVQPRSATGGET